jgi:hypothetical protein
MSFAQGPGLFADDSPIFREFEDFLRTNVSDEKTLDDALRLLTLVFLQQRSVQVGIRATLQYMIEHGELRRESHPRDEICLVPDPNDGKRYPDPYS